MRRPRAAPTSHFAYGSVQVLFGVAFDGATRARSSACSARTAPASRRCCGCSPASSHRRSGAVTLRRARRHAHARRGAVPAGVALVMGGQGRVPRPDRAGEPRARRVHRRGTGLAERIDRELERFPQLRRAPREHGRVAVRRRAAAAGDRQGAAARPHAPVHRRAVARPRPRRSSASCSRRSAPSTPPACTCVLVEQSLNIAAELCGRAVFLEKGAVRFEGHRPRPARAGRPGPGRVPGWRRGRPPTPAHPEAVLT